MQVFEHTSYRSFLKSVLADRIGNNPSYSLRAMARQLGIEPSHLCAVNNGSKNLSLETALKVASKLGLGPSESEYFCGLVQYENEKNPDLKSSYLQRLRSLNSTTEVRDLSVDMFKFIADWYHIPILEMADLDRFELEPSSVAERLGITRLEAEVALERLVRLELLERDTKGRLRKVHSNAVFKSAVPNTALRRFHRQMLEKAIASLEEQTPDEKYVGSQTFSIDVRQLPEARKRIEAFRQEMVSLFNDSKKRTETYHLGVQLFRVTKLVKEKSNAEKK